MYESSWDGQTEGYQFPVREHGSLELRQAVTQWVHDGGKLFLHGGRGVLGIAQSWFGRTWELARAPSPFEDSHVDAFVHLSSVLELSARLTSLAPRVPVELNAGKSWLLQGVPPAEQVYYVPRPQEQAGAGKPSDQCGVACALMSRGALPPLLRRFTRGCSLCGARMV